MLEVMAIEIALAIATGEGAAAIASLQRVSKSRRHGALLAPPTSSGLASFPRPIRLNNSVIAVNEKDYFPRSYLYPCRDA
jgi:hypothetical protein